MKSFSPGILNDKVEVREVRRKFVHGKILEADETKLRAAIRCFERCFAPRISNFHADSSFSRYEIVGSQTSNRETNRRTNREDRGNVDGLEKAFTRVAVR